MNQRSKHNPDELLRRAQDALDREAFEEAEALARRCLMLRPDSLDGRQLAASALIEQGRYEEAVEMLEAIVAQEPDDLPALADLGMCMFQLCQFDAAESYLTRALEIDPADPQACYWLAMCVERRADYDLADAYFARANDADPAAYVMPTRLSDEEFDRVVTTALRELPDGIRAALKNLSIEVQDLPRLEDLTVFEPPMEPCLFGLYCGVPLPERTSADLPRLPDTIYIYKRNLERMCADRDSLIHEIRITLQHEIGHFLGFDEDDLEERGLG